MKLVTFLQKDDVQQIGALANNDQSIVILQNGTKAVRGEPSPYFTDMLVFLRGGSAARDQAQAIVEYVTSQQPPTQCHCFTGSSDLTCTCTKTRIDSRYNGV